MLRSSFIAACLCFLLPAIGLAQIKTSGNGRFLATQDEKPFFWLGDTAWELFHRLTRQEASRYLETRRQQGYNVIQAVALAEINGLRTPNRYGDLPLLEEDPARLATTPGNDHTREAEYDYWDHVDYVIDKAAQKGLYIGLLPTWGDKVAHLWGEGPIIFTPENAEAFTTALAKRYGKKWNVLWILGGDRPVQYTAERDSIPTEYNDLPVWRAMARGIEKVLGKEAFITYHPAGGPNSSPQHIHQEPWLDMNAFQSGHAAREIPAWEWVYRDLALEPQKPTLDMEPCYEDHPVNPWDGQWTRKERGYFTAYDVRTRVYRSVFAGACGLTYGHHSVWQFANPELYPYISPGDTTISWQQALQAQAGKEMAYLKNLMLSRPYFSRIPDQSLIVSEKGKDYRDQRIIATRDAEGTYAMVYLPQSKPVTLDLSKLSGSTKNVWWFNPRTGKARIDKPVNEKGHHTFSPPIDGRDWVLVVDDASRKYNLPGV